MEFAIIVVEMQPIALAVAVHLTVGALALLGPLAVAIGFKAVLPHLPEVVLVDVALMQIATDAGASRNGTVVQYACHLNACATII